MAREFVFVHGGMQASWVWAPVIAALERQTAPGEIRALALDVPGCGAKRGRATAGMGVAEVVGELAGEIERAGFRGALIVGHSQAGTLMPGIAKAVGGRLRRAVYVACCAPAPGQTVAEMMGQGLHGRSDAMVGWPIDRETVSMAMLFEAMFCNDMDEATRDAFMAQLGQDFWPDACGNASRTWAYDAHPALPATYVAALRDASLPLDWQLRFADRFSAERIVRIDAGHQVMQTRPHTLAEVLLAE